MRGTVVRGIGLIVLAASAGCTVFQSHELRIDAAAGMYQSAVIDYRVDGGQLSEPLTVARIAGQHVTHRSMPSAPHPDCSVARLIVHYPHPAGNKGVALAKLIVETRTPGNPAAGARKAVWEEWGEAIASAARDIVPGMKSNDNLYEVWSLDIAKVDLDRVIAGMVQNGYFANPAKTTIGIELSAHVDNFEAMKSWTHEPDLDILMERVRRQGQLLSYQHPLEAGGSTTAVANGNNRNQTILVAHNEEGPALLPAGPQNNTYQSLPEPATPSVQQYTPPATAQPKVPYTPPQIGPYTPPQAGAQPMRPTPQIRNYQRPSTTSGGQSPPQRQPAGGPMRGRNNPAARGSYPQNRRQQAPPAANAAPAKTAPQNATGRGANPADAARSKSRIRWPWQRPNASANGQSATPMAPKATPADPRRALPGGYGRQPAPAPRNRGPSINGQPGPLPSQNGYPGYPQAAAPSDGASGGYPSGMPQPPQITSRPRGY